MFFHTLSTSKPFLRWLSKIFIAFIMVSILTLSLSPRVPDQIVLAAGGSYSLKWTAADPDLNKGPFAPTYQKLSPDKLPNPAPSGGEGRAAAPLANAIYGSPADSVSSLSPASMALGQIVPFELAITVSGSTSPENGTIVITPYFLTKTTNGGDFGYDPGYGIYSAFVDYADPASVDPLNNAKVDHYSSSIVNPATSNEQIQGTIQVSGLDNGDLVIVEIWVVLKNNILSGINGNVQTGLVGAHTVAVPADTINAGNQTVPLLKVQEFFTASADISITKTDSPDPVTQGQQLTYSIDVINHSATTVANGIIVTDTLDPNTVFVSASGAPYTLNGGIITFNVGFLSPLQSITLQVVVMVSSTAPTATDPSLNPEAGSNTSPTLFDILNLVTSTAVTSDPLLTNNTYYQPTNVLSSFVPNPHLSLAKTGVLDLTVVAPADTANVGDRIDYTITATNDGNMTLTGVTVSDPLIGPLTATFPGATGILLPGETATFTASYSLTQADIDTGHIDNTATVSSKLEDGHEGPTGTATAHIALSAAPGVHISKSSTLDMTVVSPSDIANVGDRVNYTIVVINTGTTTLTAVSVNDTILASLTPGWPGTSGTLLPGQSATFTGSYYLTQGDIDAGKVDNAAFVTAKPSQGPSIQDQISNTQPITQSPLLSIIKQLTSLPPTMLKAGDVITYTITLSNIGNIVLTGVTVSDPMLGSLTETWPGIPGTLLPGQSATFTGGYILTQTDIDIGQVYNIATADSDQTTPVEATYTEQIVQTLHLSATKGGTLDITVVAPNDRADSGDKITYTITATNDGNVTLTGVTVSDPKLGALTEIWPGTPGTLLPGQSASFAGSYTLTQADIDSGHVNNTATADSDQTEPIEATFTQDISQILHLSQTKVGTLDMTVVAPNDRADIGDQITYTIDITNDGNVTLTGVTVSDPKLGPLTETWPGTPGTLLPGQSATFTGSYTLIQADIDAGHVNNTAIADSDQTMEMDTSATVSLPQDVSLSQSKVGTLDTTVVAPTDRADAGDKINYTITVTNDGNVTLIGVTVSDSKLGALTATWPGTHGTLSPGQFATFTGTYTLTQADIDAGHVNNTAIAQVTHDGSLVSIDTTATVSIPQILHLSQTKVGILDITAAAPTDRANPGDKINYTITTINDGNVTLIGVTVNDPKLGSLIATWPDPTKPGALSPGQSATFTGSYTLTQADIDAGYLINTATADSDQTMEVDTSSTITIPQIFRLSQAKVGTLDMTVVAPTDRADVGDKIGYTITATNDGNVTLTGVTVSDPKLGALTATWPDPTKPGTLLPGQSATFTGSYTLTQTDIDAGYVNNTSTADSEQTEPVQTLNSTMVPQKPAIDITKYTSIDNGVTWQDANTAPGPYTVDGSPVQFKFVVVNVGNVTLSNITVTDNVYGTIGTVATLVPGATREFIKGSLVATAGQHTNTATVSVVFGGLSYQDNDRANYRGLPKSMVTNTEYCWFDWCPDTNGEGFRLIFTPDLPDKPNLYKLSASNPGQFYYNIFYYGDYDPNTSFTIQIPYPFVTMGAMPVHVYNSLNVNGLDPQICLTPGNDITSQFTISPPNSLSTITLASYSPQAFGQFATIKVTPKASGSGLLYITVHLDYGLKSSTTSFNKDASNNATDPVTGAILIANHKASIFSVSGLTNDSFQVYNCNVFKRFPGFAGLVTDSLGNPLKGVTVEIRGPNSTKLLAAVTTDDDGWYMHTYKHTAKPANFTVSLPKYGLSQTVSLVANKLVIVNFIVPNP